MKRILLLFVLVVLGAGAYWLWGRHHFSAPPPAISVPAGANHDARPLSAAEQAEFLPLVCGGPGAGAGGYAHSCTSLIGYPSNDYGGAGTGLGITLTSIIEGHLSNAAQDQAYVSYRGSFESHADDFGGGILFTANGKGGWTLEKWVQGGVMDGCLSLNPDGRAQFLCLRRFTGQGETDTALMLVTIPNPGGASVLTASDLRDTLDPNANCGLRRKPDQAILLSINGIARAGGNYTAQISYLPTAAAEAACKAKTVSTATPQKAVLSLSWNGATMAISPDYHFAPAESD